MNKYGPLNDTYLSLYETKKGRKVYEETLECVKRRFPQYVREIEGTADGAEVPFYKVNKISKVNFCTIHIWNYTSGLYIIIYVII